MEPTQRVVSLNPQPNMVFTVVKPVMGILQVSPSESASVALQQGPVGLQQGPVGLQQGPVALQQGSVALHQGPVALQQGPVTLQQGSVALHQGPVGLQQGPVALQQGPVTLQQGSVALHQGPVGLQQGPVGLQQSPVGLQQSPVGLQQGPISLQTPQNPNPVHHMSAQVQPHVQQVHLSPDSAEDPELGLVQDLGAGEVQHLPFAEVSSLLDPNMKGSKARKYLISYDEIRRRLQPPEKMSLRSIAAYTRVSRGPASKKTLQESLSVLGLSPSTTTAVSSSFSKLTEGDTKALCDDMKDFSQDYIDYENVAKQLIPKVNTVQHWSKIIETKNHLEDLRRLLQDPAHSQAFDSVTHGLGLGMVHVVLDMVSSVIQHQIRILSGSASAAPDLADDRPLPRRNRKRHRKFNRGGEQRTAKEVPVLKAKGGGRGRKKARRDEENAPSQAPEQQLGGANVLLVTVGYEAVSGELSEETLQS